MIAPTRGATGDSARDGAKASRIRLLWRALVCWVPISALAVFAIAVAEKRIAPGWPIAGAVVLVGLAVWSLLLPVRSLPDRLAGTWPVPR